MIGRITSSIFSNTTFHSHDHGEGDMCLLGCVSFHVTVSTSNCVPLLSLSVHHFSSNLCQKNKRVCVSLFTLRRQMRIWISQELPTQSSKIKEERGSLPSPLAQSGQSRQSWCLAGCACFQYRRWGRWRRSWPGRSSWPAPPSSHPAHAPQIYSPLTLQATQNMVPLIY